MSNIAIAPISHSCTALGQGARGSARFFSCFFILCCIYRSPLIDGFVVLFLFSLPPGSHGADGAPKSEHGDADVRGESHPAGAPRTDPRARAAGEAHHTLLVGRGMAPLFWSHVDARSHVWCGAMYLIRGLFFCLMRQRSSHLRQIYHLQIIQLMIYLQVDDTTVVPHLPFFEVCAGSG